jgi:hypothetical protein
MEALTNVSNAIGTLFKPKQQDINSNNPLSNGQYQPNNGNNNGPNGQDGGARSRRRKCNKKHRHTKSCQKYVKKGRKTRKH